MRCIPYCIYFHVAASHHVKAPAARSLLLASTHLNGFSSEIIKHRICYFGCAAIQLLSTIHRSVHSIAWNHLKVVKLICFSDRLYILVLAAVAALEANNVPSAQLFTCGTYLPFDHYNS